MIEFAVVCLKLHSLDDSIVGYQHAVVSVGDGVRALEKSCNRFHDECIDFTECEVAKDWTLVRVSSQNQAPGSHQ